jgi:uncharacterized protein (TIGR02594 family)
MSARVVHADDPKYLKAAFSVLGLSEIAGERDEEQVLAMYRACGHDEIDNDEVPWCAAYVGWCLHKGGLKNTGSLLAISYAKYPGKRFTRDDTIPRGAICLWPRTGGNHVNFALADLGDALLCIGGNQGNGRGGGVTIARTPKHLLKAAVMPEGVNAPLPRPKPPLEAPVPEKPRKTGVSEGATVGAGLGLAGILSQVWEALTQAPEQLLDVLIRAAQKPPFWLFVAVAGVGLAIWWRRSLMKREA